MKEQIKSQLRRFFDDQLQLCEYYVWEQDMTLANAIWQQAVGVAIFVSIYALDFGFSDEISAMWNKEYKGAFDKVLHREVGE